MLAIDDDLVRQIAAQSPDALGTVLANVAIDRDRLFRTTPSESFRPGWIGTDMSGHPAYAGMFPYDAKFTGAGQTVVSWLSRDHGFVLVTAKLEGETETECMIVGDGFVLRTRDLLRHRWDMADPPAIADILKVVRG